MNLNELYNENKNPFQDVVDKVAAKEKQADAEHTKGLKDIADKFQSAEKKSREEFSKKLRPSVSEEEEKTTKTKCPSATQDITLNLENRQKAIDEYGYGPLNPAMPNNKFWMKKVDEWNLDSAEEAKKSLCGNCAAFDVRRDTLDCIATGIDASDPADAEGVIDAGDLGYCKFLKFKCASRRTCDAWVGGGPLTDKQGVAEGQFDPINDDDFYEYNVNTNEIVKRISGKHPIARQFSPMQKEWAGRDADHKIVKGMYAKYLKPTVDEKVSDYLPAPLVNKHSIVKGWRKAKGLDEKAPPGDKAERMVKHIKKNYSKDGKLTPTEKSIAYATAWKAHNAGKV